MKRKLTKTLAVLLMLCMLLPQTALAATTYYIEVTLSGPDAQNVPQTVSASSSQYGKMSDNLAGTVVQLITPKETEIRTKFSGTGLSNVFEEGQTAYAAGDAAWASYIDRYDSEVTGDFKDILKNKASTFAALTLDQANQVTYTAGGKTYTVTVTLRSYTTGSSTPSGGGGGGSAEPTTPDSSKETVTNPDGSTTETITKPDGTVTESNTSKPTTDAEGNTSQTTTETTTGKDGVTASKTETTTKPDGTGSATTETTTTKPDGTKTESKTETTINKDGSTASTTTSNTTKPDGTVIESKTETTASTVTNKDGSTTETKKETTTTSTGTKTESTTVTTTKQDGSSTVTTTSTTTNKAGTVTESTTETTTKADGSSKSTTTATVTKTDGTVTTSKTESTTSLSTNKATGTVTETKKETTTTSDGVKSESTAVTQLQKDGTVTSKETVKASDSTGTTATKTTTMDAKGKVTSKTEVTVSAKAAAEAIKTGGTVAIPVEVSATKSAATAPVMTVNMPAISEGVKVEFPVENVTPGTVAVIVKADGTEEIVKTSVSTESGVALQVDSDVTVKFVDNSKIFKDVHPVNHWAQDAIDFVSSRQLFTGKTNDIFAPQSPTTRAQMMTVLARLNGADTSKEPLQQGMAWAMENGVSDGSNPNGTITRQQLAAMLYRYAGSPEVQDDVLNFPDASKVSDYAKDAMKWAVANGIIQGKADGTLDPQGLATRAQVATMMMRFCGNAAKL